MPTDQPRDRDAIERDLLAAEGLASFWEGSLRRSRSELAAYWSAQRNRWRRAYSGVEGYGDAPKHPLDDLPLDPRIYGADADNEDRIGADSSHLLDGPIGGMH